jgi:fumarate reductase flavoprotein subunit
MENDYDVAVIGAGAAGLSAAIAAADAGARTLVLEADGRVGGSSRLSGGHFYAAGTSVQRAAGILDDDPEAMFVDYMRLNQWMLEPSVVAAYCDNSAATLEWLIELGVVFQPEHLYQSGVDPVSRGHAPEGEGEEVVRVLDRQRNLRGIDLALGARVDGLLTNDAGDLTGLRAGDEVLRCGAVVIATGGFGANDDLIGRHFPDAAAAGDWVWYIGSPFAQGDGLVMGESVGAAIDGFNHGLLLVTPGFSHDLEIFLPGWVVLVDSDGRRFVDETAPYSMMAGLFKRHGGRAWAVFDEPARADAAPNPFNQAYWVDEILAAQADAGRVHRADSLAELAGQAGIDASALEGTLARYNRDVDDGTDSAFLKPAWSGMRTVRVPPFYAVEVRPAILAWTGAGLRIDATTRVISRDERPIRGLFAAGETVGSLHGDRYIGGGGSFGPCVVFGRLAGRLAADHATSTTG